MGQGLYGPRLPEHVRVHGRSYLNREVYMPSLFPISFDRNVAPEKLFSIFLSQKHQ